MRWRNNMVKECTKRSGHHIITDCEYKQMESQGVNLKRFNPHRIPDAIRYQQKVGASGGK